VFVISWVNPEQRHAEKGFEHYMTEGVFAALEAIEKATGEKQVNAAGYCVGGTLLAIALGYMAETGDERIASATFLTAQIDFEYAGDLKVFADADHIASVEAEMNKTGYLEGSKMATAFNLLRSNDLIWPYVVNDYLKGKEPLPFDLLYWNADATRMPAANHSFYLRNCYLENNLTKGRITMLGKAIDLSKVSVPVYNLATKEDHIAPAKSVFTGSRFLHGPVRFVLTGSGHIAGVVNPPARRKYQYWTGGKPSGSLEDWLAKAKEHPGSWWDDWQAWLEGDQNPRLKKKRKAGGTKLKPLCDAPGTYVLAHT
jgi:polyhydroxyalkanoate synthase